MKILCLKTNFNQAHIEDGALITSPVLQQVFFFFFSKSHSVTKDSLSINRR